MSLLISLGSAQTNLLEYGKLLQEIILFSEDKFLAAFDFINSVLLVVFVEKIAMHAISC